MKIYPLEKKVLSIKNNPAPFLNGLTTNTIDSPLNAFVNISGRIIATFEQCKISEEEWVIVVEDSAKENLLSHLKRFALLSGVKIEETAKRVYFDLEGNIPKTGDDMCIPKKKGCLFITARDLTVNVQENEFTLFRLKNNLPLQGQDYTDDFILNVSDDYVSFTKGCFLGQEPVAKVHNRSKPTWRLVVKYEDECSDEEKSKMTSRAQDPDSRRVRGFVFEGNT